MSFPLTKVVPYEKLLYLIDNCDDYIIEDNVFRIKKIKNKKKNFYG